MTASKHQIIETWLRSSRSSRSSHPAWGYVVIGMIGCPYSEEASTFFPNITRYIIWVEHGDSEYETSKKTFSQKTFPICLAVPANIMPDATSKAVFLEKRKRGIVRLGGCSDVHRVMSIISKKQKKSPDSKKK